MRVTNLVEAVVEDTNILRELPMPQHHQLDLVLVLVVVVLMVHQER
tara:strand:- start:130 stop:267 length:138 start_codon:yes stop_codon:yes gene_type:complete